MKQFATGLAVSATIALLAGCAGYQTWPSPSGQPSMLRANDAATIDVMAASLQWLIENRPPPSYEGPVAINIPEGIRMAHYQGIAGRASSRAVPVMKDNAHLPTYHVVSIRIRGSDATATMLRPAMEVQPGRWELEKYTLTLEGGLKPWTVIRPRAWVGVAEPPSLNYYEPDGQ